MARGVLRVGIDVAGGLIVGNLRPSVTVNSAPVAVLGASVASHGLGAHASATMTASSTVTAGGLPICRFGDPATCGHLGSPGSPNVSIG
jgi:uncharacterized Zn-binding protein involved in type VI secretion